MVNKCAVMCSTRPFVKFFLFAYDSKMGSTFFLKGTGNKFGVSEIAHRKRHELLVQHEAEGGASDLLRSPSRADLLYCSFGPLSRFLALPLHILYKHLRVLGAINFLCFIGFLLANDPIALAFGKKT